jgi:septal ring factor EnvC (AmiA/AmiB activator)|tara:strand:- start:31 stop:423 length:393 start_codon:yes stop_codon:yes gene_type:complete
MRKTSIRLPEELYQELANLAKTKGHTLTSIICDICLNWKQLEAEKKPTEADQKSTGASDGLNDQLKSQTASQEKRIKALEKQLEASFTMIDQEQKNAFMANKNAADLIQQNKLLQTPQSPWWKRLVGMVH